MSPIFEVCFVEDAKGKAEGAIALGGKFDQIFLGRFQEWLLDVC